MAEFGCSDGGDGGPGLRIVAPLVRLQDDILTAGPAGQGGGGCNDGQPSQDMEVDDPFFLGLSASIPAGGSVLWQVPVPELGLGIEGVPVYFTSAFATPGGDFLGSSSATVLLDRSF